MAGREKRKGPRDWSRVGMVLGVLLVAGFMFWLVSTGGMWNIRAGSPDLFWLRYEPGLIAIPVLEAVALAVGIGALKMRALEAVLATVRRLAWVPAGGEGGCDPTEGQLDRVARIFAGIAHPVTHWLDREGTAIVVDLDYIGEGRVLFEFAVPERMTPGVRAATSVVAGAELIPRDQLGLPEPPEHPLKRAPGAREEVDV